MEIDKELYKEIKMYCDLNGLKAREYIHKLLKEAFMKDKYGERPSFMVLPLRPEPKVDTVPTPKAEIITTVIPVKKTEPAVEPVVEKIKEQNVQKDEEKTEITAKETIETPIKTRKRKLN